MPEHKDQRCTTPRTHVFVHDTGSKVIVRTTPDERGAQNVEVLLADEPGGSKVVLTHNGERWIVRYDERALGDHNNFECVDEWRLRSREEAHKQFVDGFDDMPVERVRECIDDRDNTPDEEDK